MQRTHEHYAETPQALAGRFEIGSRLPATTPEQVNELFDITTERFNEAIAEGLVAERGDLQQAKGVYFDSSGEDPKVSKWLEFTKTEEDAYRIVQEYEVPPALDLFGGCILSVKSLTYRIAKSPSGLNVFDIVGFEPSFDEVDSKKDAPIGLALVGEEGAEEDEVNRHDVDFEALSLKGLALYVTNGMLLGSREGRPTLEITNLKKALLLLNSIEVIPQISNYARDLFLDIKFCDLVNPTTDHRITDR